METLIPRMERRENGWQSLLTSASFGVEIFFFDTKARTEATLKKLSAHLLPESRGSCETFDGVLRTRRERVEAKKRATDYAAQEVICVSGKNRRRGEKSRGKQSILVTEKREKKHTHKEMPVKFFLLDTKVRRDARRE